MGYHKRRLIEQEEQGWSYSDKAICPECVTEPYLRKVLRSARTSRGCDFCGQTKRRSAPFNALMETVAHTFFQYYRRAVDHLGWDSEDKDYFGDTYDTWDLINDEFSDISDDENVLQEIIDCFGDEKWCDENPYGFSGAERYVASWSEFCRTVKHRTRYFFTSASALGERIGSDNELTPVPEVLAEVQ